MKERTWRVSGCRDVEKFNSVCKVPTCLPRQELQKEEWGQFWENLRGNLKLHIERVKRIRTFVLVAALDKADVTPHALLISPFLSFSLTVLLSWSFFQIHPFYLTIFPVLKPSQKSMLC